MRASLIVIGIAFLFVGGILLAIGGRTLVREWFYRQYAVRSEAVATGKSLQFATDTSGTSYEISYRWNVDGTAGERTVSVPVQVWERTEPGSALPIEHLPGRLETARVATDSALDGSPGSLAAVGAVLVLAALVTFAKSVSLGRRPDTTAVTPRRFVPIAPARNSSCWPLARRSPGFWVGAMSLLVGTPLLVARLGASFDEWRFSRDARSTEGMVLTKEVRRSSKSERGRTYEATYRFTVEEAALEHRTILSYSDWTRLREREAARVLYLPGSPAKSRLEGQGDGVSILLLPLLGALFAGIGAIFFVRAIRTARLEWHLRRHGMSTQGTVSDLRDRHLRINGVRQWRLYYEYRDFQAQRHAGSIDLPEAEAQSWDVGDVGKVLYDPLRPVAAMWMGRDDSDYVDQPG